MIYKKALLRIDRCLSNIENRRVSEVLCDALWQSADNEEPLDEKNIPPNLEFKDIEFPYFWGKPWVNTLFKTIINYEKEDDREYYLELKTETDTLVYINDTPVGAVNPFHPLISITSFPSNFSILLEAWGGHFFPGYHPGEGGRVLTAVAERKKSYPLVFSRPRLLKKNKNIWDLFFDVKVLRGLLDTLDDKSMLYQIVLSKLHSALITLDFSSSDDALDECAKSAREMLIPVLNAHNGTIAPKILSIGNAHLDHAWLWPINETERKAARTCVNMMKYLDEYKEFYFTFTQPVQMKAIRDRYPSIFEKLKKYEESGRFEVQGISWVEPDCMLPSGESFIRQFIYGRKLIKELFGSVKNSVFWVPDSFGYNAQLPQILNGCGIKYFITSKIGWNDTNSLPYDLFTWEGLDGSQIPAHMIIDAYEGKNEPAQIMHVFNKIKHKDLQPILVRSIGEGDGGGGTMLEDIEMIKRMEDLQGLPKNKWTTLQNALKETFEAAPDLPVYKGELYLELHRGTYTVQSEVKKGNKTLEKALQELDIKISSVFSKEGMSERVEKALELLDSAYQILLTNQFHDILPGSCIKAAMDEAVESYKDGLNKVKMAEDLIKMYDPLDSSLYFSTERKFYENKISVDGDVITLPWGEVTYDQKGGFSSIKAFSRELVAPGKTFNKITYSPDETVNWDAWDMEADMIPLRKRINTAYKTTKKVYSDRVVLSVSCSISKNSKLFQNIIIRSDVPRIDFITAVNWNEEHKILRSEFETSIKNQMAEFAVPFGYISRSTGECNSIEQAQFEVPGQNFVHYGDTQNSVILTSDSKYGYRVKDSTMSISLLRSPKAPDPEADIGMHEFMYSLHFAPGGSEGLRAAIRAGYEILDSSRGLIPSLPFTFNCTKGSVILDSVKVSENKEGIVLRFYEAEGSEGKVSLSYSDKVESIFECDMIEESFNKIEGKELYFSPFKIRTIFLKLNL